MEARQTERAKRVQLEAFSVYRDGYVTSVARAIGKSRQWVSQVLNGQVVSEPTLDLIEQHLAECRRLQAA